MGNKVKSVTKPEFAKLSGLSLTTINRAASQFDLETYRTRFGQDSNKIILNKKALDFIENIKKMKSHEDNKDYITVAIFAARALVNISEVYRAIESKEVDSVKVFNRGKLITKIINNDKALAFVEKHQGNSKANKRKKNFTWMEDHLKRDKVLK